MASFSSSRFIAVNSAYHSRTVVSAIRNLFDSKRGTDFDFRWGGRSLRTHRIILELFLEPQLIATVAERQQVPVAKKEEPDGDDGNVNNILDSVLEFLYKGEVSVPEEELENLLEVAKELDFQMLVDAIVQACTFNVNVINIKDKNVNVGEPDGIFGIEDARGYSVTGNKPENVLDIKVKNFLDSSENMSEADGVFDIQDERMYTVTDAERGSPSSVVGDTLIATEWLGSKRADSPFVNHQIQRPTDCRKCLKIKFGHELSSNIETVAGPGERSFNRVTVSESVTQPNALAATKSRRRGTPTTYSCSQCQFKSLEHNKYRHHLLSVHRITVRGEPAPELKCTECDYSSVFLHRLNEHRLIKHSEGKPFACEHCSYAGKQKYYLDQHLYIAHGLGAARYSCETCGQRCVSESKLRRHLLTHSK